MRNLSEFSQKCYLSLSPHSQIFQRLERVLIDSNPRIKLQEIVLMIHFSIKNESLSKRVLRSNNLKELKPIGSETCRQLNLKSQEKKISLRLQQTKRNKQIYREYNKRMQETKSLQHTKYFGKCACATQPSISKPERLLRSKST